MLIFEQVYDIHFRIPLAADDIGFGCMTLHVYRSEKEYEQNRGDATSIAPRLPH